MTWLRDEPSATASCSGVFCQGQPRCHREGLSIIPGVAGPLLAVALCTRGCEEGPGRCLAVAQCSACPQVGHCVQLSWKGPSHLLCHQDSAALSPSFSPLRTISHPDLCLEHISVPVFHTVSSNHCPEIKQEDSCCVPAADVIVGSTFLIPSVLPAAPCAFLWKDSRKWH